MTKKDEQRAPRQENISDQVEYRLDLLQDDLKLKPEQYNAWAAYADKVKAFASDITRERSRVQVAPTGNALQQIGHSVDAARDRLTALEDIAAAAKVLYDVLSAEQKTLADERLAILLPTSAAFGQSGPAQRRPPAAGQYLGR